MHTRREDPLSLCAWQPKFPRLPFTAVRSALLTLALAVPAAGAHAGQNAGIRGSLSWSATDTTQTNLASPGAANTLYVLVSNPAGVRFKGAEIDLKWNPGGTTTCFSHIGTTIRTGTDCTYLNRGVSVPVVTADDSTHLHIAWANPSTLSNCTSGAIIALSFEFDGCASPQGCFTLNSLTVLDQNNVVDAAYLPAPSATVANGTSRCQYGGHAPVVNPIADRSIIAGRTLSVLPSASDADGDALTWSGANLPSGAFVNAYTGVLTWTASGTAGTVYPAVTLTARDPSGLQGAASFAITVAANTPPVVSPISNQTVEKGTLLTVAPTGYDPDGDLITWSGRSLPSGAVVTPATGVFSWLPSLSAVGVWNSVTLVATDAQGATGQASFSITVTNLVNAPPVIAPLGAYAVTGGRTLSFSVTASDPDNDAVTLTAVPLPPGATFAPPSFRWTPVASDSGLYVVTFTATDARAATDTEAVAINVTPNRKPVVTAIGNRVVNQGLLLTFAANASDADADLVTWSGANLPAGATVAPATGVFSWRPTLAQVGVYAGVTLIATDPYGGSGQAGFTITVTDTNFVPVIAPLGAYSVRVGVNLAFTVSASDLNGDPLTLSVNGAPQGSTFTGGLFQWTPVMGQEGDYAPVFVVLDTRGASDTEAVAIHVIGNRAPVIAPLANVTLNYGRTLSMFVSATDADYDPITLALSNAPAGMIIDRSLGYPVVRWTPTRAQVGVWNDILVTADDGHGGVGGATFRATVTDSNFVPVLAPLGIYMVREGRVLQITLSGSDANGDTLIYDAQDVPPGSTLTGPVFRWQPQAGQAGAYVVTFRVSDPLGAADTEAVAITVTPNHAPTIAAIPDRNAIAGRAVLIAPDGRDSDGDTLVWSASGLPAGATVSATSGLFAWTPTLAQIGVYDAITLYAADPLGATAAVRFRLIVASRNNLSPILAHIGPIVIAALDSLHLPLQATDGDGDPLTFTVAPMPEGAVLRRGVLAWRPTVRQVGSLHVVVCVSDSLGARDSEAVTITVNPPERPATAMLSWNAADGGARDLVSSSASVSLHLLLSDLIAPIRGADVEIAWTTAGATQATSCVTFTGAQFPADDGACHGLNGGAAEPTTLTAYPGYAHVAWINSAVDSGCAAGELVHLGFDTHECGAATSFTVRSLTLVLADGQRLAVPARAMTGPALLTPALAVVRIAPSPCRARTTVTYVLREPEDVDLALYSARGARVRQLAAGTYQPGAYARDWDGRDEHGAEMPSGIYYVQGAVGTAAVRTSVVLLR